MISSLAAYAVSGTLVYHVSHPLHHVEGKSSALKARVQVEFLNDDDAPELAGPLSFHVPVASFKSGNRNRDRNMEETLDAADYPDVTLTVRHLDWRSHKDEPEDESESWDGTAEATLQLHGVSHAVKIPVHATLDAGTFEITSHFAFDCSDYGIPRPALLLMPIADKVGIDVSLEAGPTP